jgi:drug/metabolite transporter (DMT)-like permease
MTEHTPNLRLAVLWMLGTIASFLSMAIAAREITTPGLSTFQMLFIRSTLGLLLVGGIVLWRNPALLKTHRPGLQLWRNSVHFLGQYCWFHALLLIPLAQVFAIEFTTPLWVALLAPLLLGERLNRARLLAVLLGFFGILVVLRPGLIAVDEGSLVMLLGALGFALSFLAVKKLTASDSALTIVFYMSLMQMPMSAWPALTNWVQPQLGDWPWLLIVGLGALGAHYCMSRAFAHADALQVAPIDFLRLPLAMLAGWLLYDESVSVWLLAGVALIVAGNWLNLRSRATG